MTSTFHHCYIWAVHVTTPPPRHNYDSDLLSTWQENIGLFFSFRVWFPAIWDVFPFSLLRQDVVFLFVQQDRETCRRFFNVLSKTQTVETFFVISASDATAEAFSILSQQDTETCGNVFRFSARHRPGEFFQFFSKTCTLLKIFPPFLARHRASAEAFPAFLPQDAKTF